MKNFITIKYIDALYYTTEVLNYRKLTTHIALGKLVQFSDDSLKIIFSEKNGKPESGLLIPMGAIILNDNKSKIMIKFDIKRNVDVGVSWKDIVFFTKGRIPDNCTRMYSEGKFISENDDVVILKNPTTIMLKNKIQNHPKVKATFTVIPKVMIATIQTYDK